MWRNRGELAKAIGGRRKRGLRYNENWASEMLATKDLEFHKQFFHKFGCLDKGRIKLEVDAKALTEDFVYSPYTPIHGVPFRIGVKRDGYFKNYIVAYIFCNDNDVIKSDYSVKADFTIKTPGSKCYRSGPPYEFSPSKRSEKESSSWDYAASKAANGGRFCVQADIKVVSFYKACNVDATAPAALPVDVTLLVDGRKFPHNKNYLAHYSEYFKVAFESDFAERNETEIELKDISAYDFQSLLDVIAPPQSRQPIRPCTVAGILRMADYFDVEFARRECTKYLLSVYGMSYGARLALSEEFRIAEVQHALLRALGERGQLGAVVKSKDFSKLSETLQTFLLYKYFNCYGESPFW